MFHVPCLKLRSVDTNAIWGEQLHVPGGYGLCAGGQLEGRTAAKPATTLPAPADAVSPGNSLQPAQRPLLKPLLTRRIALLLLLKLAMTGPQP